jgi:hypothetical protein
MDSAMTKRTLNHILYRRDLRFKSQQISNLCVKLWGLHLGYGIYLEQRVIFSKCMYAGGYLSTKQQSRCMEETAFRHELENKTRSHIPFRGRVEIVKQQERRSKRKNIYYGNWCAIAFQSM